MCTKNPSEKGLLTEIHISIISEKTFKFNKFGYEKVYKVNAFLTLTHK
jgi:hypothetical protein